MFFSILFLYSDLTLYLFFIKSLNIGSYNIKHF